MASPHSPPRPLDSDTLKDEVIIETTEDDVFGGRGRASMLAPGNKKFLHYVALHSDGYNKAVRKDKGIFLKKVINEVHGKGGRFLMPLDELSDRNGGLKMYRLMTQKEIRKKVGHAFRDAPRYHIQIRYRKGPNGEPTFPKEMLPPRRRSSGYKQREAAIYAAMKPTLEGTQVGNTSTVNAQKAKSPAPRASLVTQNRNTFNTYLSCQAHLQNSRQLPANSLQFPQHHSFQHHRPSSSQLGQKTANTTMLFRNGSYSYNNSKPEITTTLSMRLPQLQQVPQRTLVDKIAQAPPKPNAGGVREMNGLEKLSLAAASMVTDRHRREGVSTKPNIISPGPVLQPKKKQKRANDTEQQQLNATHGATAPAATPAQHCRPMSAPYNYTVQPCPAPTADCAAPQASQVHPVKPRLSDHFLDDSGNIGAILPISSPSLQMRQHNLIAKLKSLYKETQELADILCSGGTNRHHLPPADEQKAHSYRELTHKRTISFLRQLLDQQEEDSLGGLPTTGDAALNHGNITDSEPQIESIIPTIHDVMLDCDYKTSLFTYCPTNQYPESLRLEQLIDDHRDAYASLGGKTGKTRTTMIARMIWSKINGRFLVSRDHGLSYAELEFPLIIDFIRDAMDEACGRENARKVRYSLADKAKSHHASSVTWEKQRDGITDKSLEMTSERATIPEEPTVQGALVPGRSSALTRKKGALSRGRVSPSDGSEDDLSCEESAQGGGSDAGGVPGDSHSQIGQENETDEQFALRVQSMLFTRQKEKEQASFELGASIVIDTA